MVAQIAEHPPYALELDNCVSQHLIFFFQGPHTKFDGVLSGVR